MVIQSSYLQLSNGTRLRTTNIMAGKNVGERNFTGHRKCWWNFRRMKLSPRFAPNWTYSWATIPGRPSSATFRAPKIPKEFLWNEASNLNRHQLDLYLSYGARSCADRELSPSSRSAQERAPYDKYKSSGWRFKLEAPFHKNSFGIFGAVNVAEDGSPFYMRYGTYENT